MSPGQQVLVMLLASVQISLAVSAWADLAQRAPEQVRGRKRTWAGVIAINVIGPVTYFLFGRTRLNRR